MQLPVSERVQFQENFKSQQAENSVGILLVFWYVLKADLYFKMICLIDIALLWSQDSSQGRI